MSPINSTDNMLSVSLFLSDHEPVLMGTGSIFFILNIIFYLINVTMTISRAVRHPKVFKQSFYDRSEAVWFPTSVIGMATLIIGTILFGIPRCGVSSWLVS